MKKKSALLMALALGATTLAGMSNTAVNAETAPQKYLVVFKQESNLPAGYQDVIQQAGGTVTRAIPQLGAIEVVSDNANFLNQVKGSSLIQDVNLENTVYPEEMPEALEYLNTDAFGGITQANDLYNTYGWDIKQVTGNGEAWNLPGGTGKSANGKDIVVAVLDTGIDYNHPDIKANYAYGKSFVPGHTDAIDQNGHGTHVAGSIAANGRVLGVGPDLKVAAYRVFGPTGGAATADIAAALMAAADDNVDVVNMSLGGYDWFQDPAYATSDIVADVRLFNRAIQYAIQAGVTVVGSAGNNNMDISKRGQLARDLGVTTGTVHRSPSTQQLLRVASNGFELNRAYYSNYGNGMIDVTAPGGDYGTAWLPTRDLSLREGTKRALSTVPVLDRDKNVVGHGYAWYQGTSMAAPKAAALAGLVIAKHGKDVLAPSQVKHIIQTTATDINKPGYDEEAGHGLINAVNALK